MRYQTWGISRFRLYLFALIPILAWGLFRVQTSPELSLHSLFLYFRTLIWIWGSVWLIVSLVWIYFFRRGIFQARFFAYFCLFSEVFAELFQSVRDRDLLHLLTALVFFGVVIAMLRWMESWVELAAFNPKMRWFEGAPKPLPHVSLKLRASADQPWIEASVRRLDAKGLFVLFPSSVDPAALAFRVDQRIEFELHWKGLVVPGEGVLVGRLQDFNTTQQISGIGLLFLPKGLYHFIQYTALFEALKGEGYAV